MALRLIEIIVPEQEGDAVRQLLEKQQILGSWRDEEKERLLMQVVVAAEEAEGIMDEVQRRFSLMGNFHVVLFPIDASLPRPQREQEAEGREGTPAEPAKSYRISREELYAEAADGTKTSRVFVAMTVLSSVVATVGLLRDDLAVVIGAMVIAPLLSPNVALALATTLGDFHLARDALRANVVGVGIALVLSAIVGAFVAVDPSIPALLTRTQIGPVDLVLALAAGAAGALAFTTGIPGAVIGVMVAVALLPPSVTLGLLLGSGHGSAAFGALLLLTANVICVNLAGVATFLLQGVRPRTWWEVERARKASRTAMLLWAVLLTLLAVTIVLARPGQP